MLTGGDLRGALDALHAIGEDAPANFARRGVASLSRLIGSELTTLSVCDLDSNHRSVVSDAPGAISSRELRASGIPKVSPGSVARVVSRSGTSGSTQLSTSARTVNGTAARKTVCSDAA